MMQMTWQRLTMPPKQNMELIQRVHINVTILEKQGLCWGNLCPFFNCELTILARHRFLFFFLKELAQPIRNQIMKIKT